MYEDVLCPICKSNRLIYKNYEILDVIYFNDCGYCEQLDKFWLNHVNGNLQPPHLLDNYKKFLLAKQQ